MIVIRVEGGLIQGIYSDDPQQMHKKALVIDGDIDGCEEELTSIDGSNCYVHTETIEPLEYCSDQFAIDCKQTQE